MTKDKCSMAGCSKQVHARGWCGTHYERWRQHGDPGLVKRARHNDPEQAFAARIERSGECLIWTGAKYPNGYGQIRVNNKIIRTHRYAWERVNGPIPEGMVVDHMCFNRACVNVGHLRVGTRSDNNSNRTGANRDSRTGIRGVGLHKKSGLWISRVTVNGKLHAEYSKTIEEAEEKVIAMRRKLMPFSQEPKEDQR